MEWDGKVGHSSLTCAASGRFLAPGEIFYSGLGLSAGIFSRLDFSAEMWPAQNQASFLSWWRQTVPVDDRKRKTLKFNAESLIHIFNDLKDSTERPQHCFCYVVALCLARMRKLHLLSVANDEIGAVLLFEYRPLQVVHRIRDPCMTQAEQELVHRNLLEVIGIDGSPTSNVG